MVCEASHPARVHAGSTMKYLPHALAGMHAFLTVLIFATAISSPERSGLLPLILYVADYPCSIVMNWLRNALHPDWSVQANLAVDGAVFLIIGSCWYYLIGSMLRGLIEKLMAWTRA